MKLIYDVIIVGGGPAGSAAGIRLAQKGFKTLLIDKSDFPRDKSCGDGLTRTTTKLLKELGILHKFAAFQRIHGVDVYVEDEGSRSFVYPDNLPEPNYGLVVPRFQLDNILHQTAVAAGVEFLGKLNCSSLLFNDSGKVSGVRLSNDQEYLADLVIGADGAASKIAYQTGLHTTPKNQLGFGLRGYYKNIEGLHDKLEIYLPILNSSNTHVLPSYGWVFPLGDNKANIGVGLMEKTVHDNIQTVMDSFVNKLMKSDRRFQQMELEDKFFGAPMRFDFNPKNTFAPGLLLTGDAAGLISPFTGEGIGYAIETGILAADLYIKLKKQNGSDFFDLSEYGKLLASKYQGYFETGITSVNRYHLVWKVLKNTFQNEKPLFNAVRQATVFPEGIGESFFDYFTEDVSEHIQTCPAEIRTDMLMISQNLIDITREDWPFLSRLFIAKQVTPGIPFRPSLFLLLAAYTDFADRDTLIKLGTSIELGFAASICHESVTEGKRKNGSPNWGNMLSILLGDFLLSKSFENISLLDNKFINTISESIAVSSQALFILKNKIETELDSVTLDDYIDLCYMKNRNSFELFFQLGSQLRKATMREMGTLREFGKHFGTAYFIMEDTIRFMEKIEFPDRSTKSFFYSGNEQLNLMNVLISQKNKTSATTSASICYKTVVAEIGKAVHAIDELGDEALKQSLGNISNFVLKKLQTNIPL